jgi:hypothetical protein
VRSAAREPPFQQSTYNTHGSSSSSLKSFSGNLFFSSPASIRYTGEKEIIRYSNTRREYIGCFSI